MGDVIRPDMVTKADIEPQSILESAYAYGLDSVVVIGFRDGEFYLASSDAEAGSVLYALQRAEIEIMRLSMEANEQ